MKKTLFFGILAMLISMAAKAQVENAIKYFDENGEEKSKKQTEATKIADNTTTTLDNKWYYVSDEITFDGAISVSGDVHLILCDGATLTAKEGIVVNSGNSLTIYGQSNGDNTGKLVATGNNGSAGIGSQMYYTSGTITINGGNIGATGSEDTYGYTSAGIGGAVYGGGGKIFLNGGNITASSIGSYDGRSGIIIIRSAATIDASSVLNAPAPNIISQFDYFDGKILYYVVDDENHYVSVGDGISTAWLGDGDEVDIPATVKIGDQTYTVTKIAASAFNECEDLKKVTLPSTLTYIGEAAFRNLRNWHGELAIPDGVTEIAKDAFMLCGNLQVKFGEHSALETIGDCAFLQSQISGEINLPSTLKTIGSAAFQQTGNLKKINIPASVESIGSFAFQSSGLTSISFAEKNGKLTEISNSMFLGSNIGSDGLTIIIPSYIQKIGASAFNQCHYLTSITFQTDDDGNGVEIIGDKAFWYCRPDGYGVGGLGSITFPACVTTFGEDLFENCDVLSTVTIQNPEPTLGANPFGVGKSSPTTLIIPQCADPTNFSAWADCFGGGIENVAANLGDAGLTDDIIKTYDGNNILDPFNKEYTDVNGNVFLIKSLSFWEQKDAGIIKSTDAGTDKIIKATYDLTTTGNANPCVQGATARLASKTGSITPITITNEEIKSHIYTNKMEDGTNFYAIAKDYIGEGPLDGSNTALLYKHATTGETIKYYLTAVYVDVDGNEISSAADAKQIKVSLPADGSGKEGVYYPTQSSPTPNYVFESSEPFFFNGSIGGNSIYGVISGTTLTIKYGNPDDEPAGTTPLYANTSSDNYPAWTSESGNTSITVVQIDPSLRQARPTTLAKWFANLQEVEQISGLENLVTTSVTSMAEMFASCVKLRDFALDNFNTANVQDMSKMFCNCSGLTTLNLGSFNTHSVTTMTDMFKDATKLTTIYVGDNWSIAEGNGDGMFSNCTNLVGGEGTAYKDNTDANKDNAKYAVIDVYSYVYPFGMMYNPAGYLTSVSHHGYAIYKDGTLSFHSGAKPDYIEGEYYELNDPNIVPGWHDDHAADITKVEIGEPIYPITCFKWFEDCAKLTSVTGLGQIYGTPESLYGMFKGCANLSAVENIKSIKTINCTSFKEMFYGCSSLTELDLSTWSLPTATNSAINMIQMFYGYTNLTYIDLSGWDTQEVKYTTSMFQGCSNLTTILVGTNWSRDGISNTLIDYQNMFDGCEKLIGNAGTMYDINNTDKTYAVIDDPDDGERGYLTIGEPKIFLNTSSGIYEGSTTIDLTYSEVTLPTNLTKDGYTLKGWQRIMDKDTSTLADNFTTKVARTAGNGWYKAIWQLTQYSINFPEGFTATTGSPATEVTSATQGTTITLTYNGSEPIKGVEIFPMPKSILINAAGPLGLFVGRTATLTCTIEPDGILEEDKVVKWTSSDENVLKVGLNTGILEGVTPGDATITVETTNGKTASIEVTVQ